MSARSNGVTNVELRRRMISCVAPSATCSTWRIRSASAGRSAGCARMSSSSSSAPSTRFAAAPASRSKNVVSRGVNRQRIVGSLHLGRAVVSVARAVTR
jgi:hypothetical protein